jgi:hypothetical protein
MPVLRRNYNDRSGSPSDLTVWALTSASAGCGHDTASAENGYTGRGPSPRSLDHLVSGGEQ